MIDNSGGICRAHISCRPVDIECFTTLANSLHSDIRDNYIGMYNSDIATCNVIRFHQFINETIGVGNHLDAPCACSYRWYDNIHRLGVAAASNDCSILLHTGEGNNIGAVGGIHQTNTIGNPGARSFIASIFNGIGKINSLSHLPNWRQLHS